MYIDGVNLPDPSTERELADLLAEADRAHLGVTPKGSATKQDWGNPPSRACFYLSTAKLNRVLEHAWADMTVTVEAGCTFGVLQATLAEHGQRLTADPLWPQKATVGGVLATNDTGALRLMYGGLRDLIIGITLALPDGTLAKSGGKVVKNVAGYDLMKLATGALGTLGVITQATFRVYPLPRESRSFTARFANPAAAGEFVVRVLAEPLALTSMQVRGSEVDILIEGTQAGIAAQQGVDEQTALKKGMEEKSIEFVKKGAEVYHKA